MATGHMITIGSDDGSYSFNIRLEELVLLLRRTPSRLCQTRLRSKIAEALEVSLDYLVGNASVIIKDKKMLYRLELLDKIAEYDKNTILKVVDSFLKDAQTHIRIKN